MSTTLQGPGANGAAPRTGPPLTATSRRLADFSVTRRPRRSWGTVALAALLVVASGLAVAAWGLHAGQKQSVVTLRVPVAEGQVIERGDLTSTSVAGIEDVIAIADLESVVGQTAAVDLVAGQVLTSSAITAVSVPGPGQALVGLSLDATRVPTAGLNAGDRVDVIAVPGAPDAADSPNGEGLEVPEVLADEAAVYAVQGDPAAGGQLQVTLVVEADEAAPLTAYSTQNRAALFEVAVGQQDGTSP